MKHDIAFIIADLGCGGTQRVVVNLASTWANDARRICVITLASSESDFFALDPRVTRMTIGGLGQSRSSVHAIGANLRRLMRLRRALRDADPHSIVSFVGSINVLTILAAVGLGRQVVISERNDPARQSHGAIWNILQRLLYRHADLVTANSRGAVDALRRFVPASKLVFVPNPILMPTTPVPAASKTVCNAPNFLIVGRLHHQKAHDILLTAFAQLIATMPTWRLSVVGGGQLEHALKRQSESLGISDHVDWIGETKDPFAYYADAGCFILPSRFEGTPNALLEAMACGLPVVVSNASPGPLEFVEDEITGLVVPVEDANALAAAMIRLARDAELRTKLGSAARSRIIAQDPNQTITIWENYLGFASRDDQYFRDRHAAS